MNTVFFDPKMSDQERRRQLYEGQLLVFSPNKSSLALCRVAHELAQEAFAPHDPREAQYHLPVEKYVETLAILKPREAQLLLLRANGLAYRELAQTLGIQPGSIGTLLARAEAEFERKYRARYGGEA